MGRDVIAPVYIEADGADQCGSRALRASHAIGWQVGVNRVNRM